MAKIRLGPGRTALVAVLALSGLGALANEGDHPLFYRSEDPHPHWQGGEAGGGTAGNTLFYGGDFDGRALLANERNNYRGRSAIYDNFVVPAPGWRVTAVFANLFYNYTSSGGDFEIRRGVSSGNGGTLLYSGAGLPVTTTPTGRTYQGRNEYTVRISNLDIMLPAGEYWLMARTITFACGGGWYIGGGGTTSGANGIGQPLGDGRSYFTSSSRNFVPTSTLLGAGTWDFSYGVDGSVVPEPLTAAAMAGSLLLLALRKRK